MYKKIKIVNRLAMIILAVFLMYNVDYCRVGSSGSRFSSRVISGLNHTHQTSSDVGFVPRENLDVRVAAQDRASSSFEDLRSKRVAQIYQDLAVKIMKVQENLVVTIDEYVSKLPSYSKKRSDELFSYLDSMVAGFRAQMNVLKTLAVAQYFSFVQDNDPSFVYSPALTPDEQIFIEGVENILQDAIVRIQSMAIDITSKDMSASLSADLVHGFYESSVQAQQAYEQQQKLNKQNISKSWWETLQTGVTGFLKEFSQNFMKELGVEVAKQTKVALEDIAGDVISHVGGKAVEQIKEHITPALQAKIEGLTEELKNKHLSFLFNDHSDVAMIALKRVIRLKYKVSVPTEDIVVRSSKDLSSQELEFRKNRLAKVAKVQKEQFQIDKPVGIAICCSGGGNRAMVGTLGFLIAAARHQFLQSTMYCAGLSGSTWTIAPWSYLYLKNLISHKSYEDSLLALKNNFIRTLVNPSMINLGGKDIYTPPMLVGDAKTTFADQMVVRFGYNQHISLVDVWGALVGDYALKLAGDNCLNARFTEVADRVLSGDIPMPLCSAAFDARKDSAQTRTQAVGGLYDWFEFSPIQAGSRSLGYIPIAYLGSSFKDGKLVKDLIDPEYPLSFYLGVCGSAFSLTLNDAIEKGLPTPTIKVFDNDVEIPVGLWIKRLIDEQAEDQARSKRVQKMHAKFSNFSVGLSDSILTASEDIGLFDGGIAFNIPLPLVLDDPKRGIDVVIMYDSNPADVDTLKNADAYFKRKGIAVPTMSGYSKKSLLSRDMTVFNDPRETSKYNSKMPTLIYFPTNVDVSKPPFTTANFRYTETDITTLMQKVIDAFESQIEEMTEIVQKVSRIRVAKKA